MSKRLSILLIDIYLSLEIENSALNAFRPFLHRVPFAFANEAQLDKTEILKTLQFLSVDQLMTSFQTDLNFRFCEGRLLWIIHVNSRASFLTVLS